MESPIWGVSFSRRQCEYLGLDWRDSLRILAGSGIRRVRLSVYWDEVESDGGKYDFSQIEAELDLAHELNLQVMLSLGMKAQRYPEFYIPSQYSNPELAHKGVMKFLAAGIERYKVHPAMETWQVENEPLQPSGPKQWRIKLKDLQSEIDLFTKLDPNHKLCVNIWGNDLLRPRLWRDILMLKGIHKLGFDIYPNQADKVRGYRGPDLPKWAFRGICRVVRSRGVSPIITELQAEPWEEGFDFRKHPDKIDSISLDKISQNIRDYAYLGFDEVYLWGAEYWVWAGILSEVQAIMNSGGKV